MTISLSASYLVTEASNLDTIFDQSVYGDSDGAVVGWSSSASITAVVLASGGAGSEYTITDEYSPGQAYLTALTTGKIGLSYSTDVECFVPISKSDTVLTVGASAQWDFIGNLSNETGAATDGATVLVRGGYLSGGLFKRLTVSGTTATYDEDKSARQAYSFSYLALEGVSTGNILTLYRDTSNNAKCLVVDVATGATITVGASSDTTFDIPAVTQGGPAGDLTFLSTGKSVASIRRRAGANDHLSLFTVNTSGNTVSGYGTPENIYSAASTSGVAGAHIDKVTADKIVAFYEQSGSGILQTFNVSGDTITAASDNQTITACFVETHDVVMLSETNGIATYKNALGDLLYTYFNVSQPLTDSLKILGLDSNETYTFITSFSAGNFYHKTYENAASIVSASFGAGSESDLLSGCYILKPAFYNNRLFVWGRDGSGSQVHISTNSGCTFENFSASEWSDTDKMIAFMPTGFDDYLALFESGCAWQTISGSGGWFKVSDGFSGCLVAADRNRVNDRALLAADQTEKQWSLNSGESYTEAGTSTGASTSKVRWIYE